MALTISIASDADLRAIDRARKSLDDFEQKANTTGRKLQNLGGGLKKAGMGLSMFSAAAVAGLVAFGKSAVDAAVESEQAVARLDQIAESMGVMEKNLGGSTQRLTDFADTLQHTIGVEDEAIINTQSLLLTFGKVAKTAGEAGGAFDRATQAAFDLSAAGFGSAESSAKMLGKALNDPLKGITALSRAGVTFTEKQKEQIANFVKTGDVAAAQNIILSEVEKQVGGVAEATATGGAKMKVAFAAFTEQVGMFLLPIVQKLTTLLVERVLPVLQNLMDRFMELPTPVKIAVASIGLLVLAAGPLLLVLGSLATAMGALGAATLTALFPIIAIVAGVALLVAGFVLLYKKSEVFRTAVQAAFEQIRATIAYVVDQVKAKLEENADAIEQVRTVLSKLGTFLTSVVFPILVQFWSNYLQAVFKVLGLIIGAIIDIIGGLIRLTAGLIAFGGNVATWATSTLETVKGFANGVVTIITDAFDAAGKFIGGVFLSIVENVRDSVRRVVMLMVTAINAVISAFNRFKLEIPRIDLGILGGVGPFTVDFPDLPMIPVPKLNEINAMADGGLVMGPTLALIGEAGPEAVIPLDRKHSMGATFHITVNAGLGTDGASVGRQIVDAIRKFERFSGPVFQAA